MESLVNYKLKEFLKKDLETVGRYTYLLKHTAAKDTDKQLINMPLRFVDYIKKTVPNASFDDIIDIIAHLNGVEMDDVLEISIVDFFGYMKSVTSQLEKLVEVEEERLTSKYPSSKWEMVGGSEKMSPFGIFNTLERLSNGDVLKWESLLDMPYNLIVTKLFMDTVRGDVEHEMSKIKTNTE